MDSPLYNLDLKKMKTWDLVNAYPTKWTGPTFNSGNNDITVETLELVHHGFKMNDWS